MTEIDLKKEWPWCGVPDHIAIDNGLDFPGNVVALTCPQLGIEVMCMPPRDPWYKGSIERFGRTINTRLVHGFPDSIIDGETADD